MTSQPASEGATTGSAETRPKAVAKRPKATLGPLTELHPKHRLLIQYMVHGVDKPHLVDYLYRATPTEDDPDGRRPLKAHEPLRLEEAADVLFMRHRHARHLFKQPVFQKEIAAQLETLRDGAKARAMHRIIALVEEGDGSAAFAKVNLAAATAILGETVSKPDRPAVTVNVGLNMSAGVVVRLPQGIAPPPLELQAINQDDDNEQ